MVRPKKVLSQEELEIVRDAWAASNGKIDQVAQELGVTWQTARRWLVQAGCVDKHNKRVDRPGLVWPKFMVQAGFASVVVEAPNWAVACAMVHKYAPDIIIKTVTHVDINTEADFERSVVKEECPEYMDGTLSIRDLMQYYVNSGVVVC